MFKQWKTSLMILLAALAVASMLGGVALAAKGGKPKPPPEPPTLPVVYTMHLLPLPADSHPHALGMNNSGDVVGVADYGGFLQSGFLYSAELGQAVELNRLILGQEPPVLPPTGPTITNGQDINDSGQITGGFYTTNTHDGQWRLHGFRYTPPNEESEGEFVDLGTLSDDYPSTYPQAINSAGDVVGIAENHDTNLTRAFVWTQQDGIQDVGVVGDYDYDKGWAFDINDLGEVTGSIKVNGQALAFRYTPGFGVDDLGVLDKKRPHSSGRGINIWGEVTGNCYGVGTGYYYRAFHYTDSNGLVDLGTLYGGRYTFSKGSAINDSGQIVGSTGEGHALEPESTVFLYTKATGMLDVMTLIADPPEGLVETSVEVTGINNFPNHVFGQICGAAVVDSTYRTFILTPDR